MWKRIQTWLLLAAGILLLLMFSLDMCRYVNPDSGSVYSIRFVDSIIYIILTVMSLLVTLFAFLSSPKPFNQIFFCIMDAIVLLGYQAWVLVDFFTKKLQSGVRLSEVYSLRVGAVFPLVCIVLVIMTAHYARRT